LNLVGIAGNHNRIALVVGGVGGTYSGCKNRVEIGVTHRPLGEVAVGAVQSVNSAQSLIAGAAGGTDASAARAAALVNSHPPSAALMLINFRRLKMSFVWIISAPLRRVLSEFPDCFRLYIQASGSGDAAIPKAGVFDGPFLCGEVHVGQPIALRIAAAHSKLSSKLQA